MPQEEGECEMVGDSIGGRVVVPGAWVKQWRHAGPCPGQEGLYIRIVFSPTLTHIYFTCRRGGRGGQARPEGTRDGACEEGRWGGPGCLWHLLQPLVRTPAECRREPPSRRDGLAPSLQMGRLRPGVGGESPLRSQGPMAGIGLCPSPELLP